MADRYRAGSIQKLINRVARAASLTGAGPVWELTTTGHASGEPRTVPVAPIEVGGDHYLVAAYGIVGWVQNLRSSGTATLARGRTRRSIAVSEVEPEEAGRVLAAYYPSYALILAPHFDLPSKPTVEDFAAVAGGHPVFRIEVLST
jgi:deazaflavin-dependent oxidoreductase (nitroreductase family)